MSDQKNPVGWFEIPTGDMERAIQFYQAVFGIQLDRHDIGGVDMAWFPMNPKGMGAAGALVHHQEWYKPSKDGVLIYFTTPSGDLEEDAKRIEEAGGQVVQPKMSIGEHGFIMMGMDTEGNRIAFHSMEGAEKNCED